MKLAGRIIFIILFISLQSVQAFDMTNVAAYPVPFNPHKTKLTVDNPSASLGLHTVRVGIYDINGDLVINKTVSSFPFIWNGRNSSGRFVKPGLYIIKVEIDDNDDGDYGKKVIRILVDY